MRMYRGKLSHSEVQLTIDTLSAYYEAHRAIIATLLGLILVLTIATCFLATQGVRKGLTPRCQILLEVQDQRFAEEC